MSTKAQKSEKHNQNKKKTNEQKKDMADVLPRRCTDKKGTKKEKKNTHI